jgi:hypothetical protein
MCCILRIVFGTRKNFEALAYQCSHAITLFKGAAGRPVCASHWQTSYPRKARQIAVSAGASSDPSSVCGCCHRFSADLYIDDRGNLVDTVSGKVINDFGATRFDVAVRALRGELDPPKWVEVSYSSKCTNASLVIPALPWPARVISISQGSMGDARDVYSWLEGLPICLLS